MDEALIPKTGYIDLKRFAASLVVVLYFLTITVINQVSSSIVKASYYLVMFLGLIVLVIERRSVRLSPILLYMCLSVVPGICNVVLVGNLTWVMLMILVLSFALAALFMDDAVDERAFRIAFDVNVLVIGAKLLLKGSSGQIFVGSSNNYVSIHLMAPMVLFYSLSNIRGKKVSFIPAILSFLLSILAGGRGGFLACAFMLAGLLLVAFLRDEATRRERVLLGSVLVLILIPAVIILIRALADAFSDLYLISQFTEKGMNGGGRLVGWTEYITKTLQSPIRFLFGTPIDEIAWAQYFGGNLHNSFLFVHAYLGIGGFVFLIVMLVRAVRAGIRAHLWIYVLSILAFALRGFTDHVFGVNRFTVVILTLLFMPMIFKQGKAEGDKLNKGGISQ